MSMWVHISFGQPPEILPPFPKAISVDRSGFTTPEGIDITNSSLTSLLVLPLRVPGFRLKTIDPAHESSTTCQMGSRQNGTRFAVMR